MDLSFQSLEPCIFHPYVAGSYKAERIFTLVYSHGYTSVFIIDTKIYIYINVHVSIIVHKIIQRLIFFSICLRMCAMCLIIILLTFDLLF